MNRRGFLGAMLAACAAPAIVRAESIMRVRPIVLPGEAEFEAVAVGNRLMTPAEISRVALLMIQQNIRDAAAIDCKWDLAIGRESDQYVKVWMANPGRRINA